MRTSITLECTTSGVLSYFSRDRGSSFADKVPPRGSSSRLQIPGTAAAQGFQMTGLFQGPDGDCHL